MRLLITEDMLGSTREEAPYYRSMTWLNMERRPEFRVLKTPSRFESVARDLNPRLEIIKAGALLAALSAEN